MTDKEDGKSKEILVCEKLFNHPQNIVISNIIVSVVRDTDRFNKSIESMNYFVKSTYFRIYIQTKDCLYTTCIHY